jgi:Ca-activated chloride channel homolog
MATQRRTVAKKTLIHCLLLTGVFLGAKGSTAAQEDQGSIRVNVNLVQVNVAVTDRKGNYVTGLRPQDFSVTEDRIPEKLATFEAGGESTQSTHSATDDASSEYAPAGEVEAEGHQSGSSSANQVPAPESRFSDANVFILFDTSNYMYRTFVYAQDAIADFIRSLQSANKVAFYSYSRDLSRAAPLTSDRHQILRSVRGTVAGDNAALYDCLLLTVKDAARISGRKVVVVFSNGPDNASLVPPEDVAELAQSTGTIIYMVSTAQAQIEPISTVVFERMSKATGGKAYFAKNWTDESKAFASIRDDLSHLYFLSYYPQPNSNHGWRTITVKLVGKELQSYHVRTRDGYRLQQTKASQVNSAAIESGDPKPAN